MRALVSLIFAGFILASSGALPARAQTANVAHLAVQSGNGQAPSQAHSASLQVFQPISVLATDVNNNPVAGATVTWTNLPGNSGQMQLNSGATTVTNGNGIATQDISYPLLEIYTSISNPYDVLTIQASSNNQSVTFTETESLITPQDVSVIQADPPTYGASGPLLGEATISGNAGSALTTPIVTQVAGLDVASFGVPNISVRILNNQTSPQMTCASQGGYADPGSVLSGPQGTADCIPILSGTGTGSFYILVGGISAAPGTSLANALYLQAFGPYNFTSIPGTPAAFQIVSGNNQVGTIGEQLQPLVAKLVDATGNPVPGQNVVWSVIPANAAGLSKTGGSTTDVNGEVSETVFLDGTAAAITVTLQSNSTISATFQETTTGAVTALNIVAGNGQTAQTGTAFGQPLLVQVLGASGPLANYPVQYLVNGPVTLSATTATTNSSGDASVTVTAGAVAGSATVEAIAGLLNQTFNLTVTSTPTGPVPGAITVVSGSGQSAVEGAAFGQPLVVQVNSASGSPISGYTVNFSSLGPLTLSSTSAVTNASGQASITVTAGPVSGLATVTASVTGYTATFNLTVLTQGPQVTVESFLNAASRQVGQLSPCSLAIISAQGLTQGNPSYTLAPIFGRYPKTASGLTVTFDGVPAPILSVAMGQTNPEATVQVPCEVTPGSSVPVVVTLNGGTPTTVNIPIYNVSPGIFQQVMSDGTSRAVAVRSDGSFADIGGTDSYDPDNPIRLGEVVRFYMTGLGTTDPMMATDAIEDPNSYLVGKENYVTGTVSLGFANTNVIVSDLTAHQAPGLIGVYEVDVEIPTSAPTGNNVPFYIGIVPTGATSTTPVYAPNSVIAIGQ